MASPQPSPACTTLVRAFEGLGDGDGAKPGLQAYFDIKGVATIGYGHVLLDSTGHQIRLRYPGDADAIAATGRAVERLFGADSIDAQTAASLLSRDIATAGRGLADVLYGIATSQAQMDALTSLAFNIGVQAFSMSTVLSRHKAGVAVAHDLDFRALEEAAQEHRMAGGMEGAFGAWSHACGAFSLGLFRRRMAEAMIYRGDDTQAAIQAAWTIK